MLTPIFLERSRFVCVCVCLFGFLVVSFNLRTIEGSWRPGSRSSHMRCKPEQQGRRESREPLTESEEESKQQLNLI